MNSDEAFLRTICMDPANNVPRLVYADWLEERGDERAEFIRVQIDLASYGNGGCPNRKTWGDIHGVPQTLFGLPIIIAGSECGKCRWCQLRQREQELIEKNGTTWLPTIDGLAKASHFASGELTANKVGWCLKRSGEGGFAIETGWRRGFVSEILCRVVDWGGGRCQATGMAHHDTGEYRYGIDCPACNGTGRIKANGPTIVASCPIETLKFTESLDILPTLDVPWSAITPHEGYVFQTADDWKLAFEQGGLQWARKEAEKLWEKEGQHAN